MRNKKSSFEVVSFTAYGIINYFLSTKEKNLFFSSILLFIKSYFLRTIIMRNKYHCFATKDQSQNQRKQIHDKKNIQRIISAPSGIYNFLCGADGNL